MSAIHSGLEPASEADASTSTGMPASTAEPTDGARRLFQAGDKVSDRYRILRFIASGGMGEVYAALDSELGQPVALKAVRPEVALHSQTLRRFRREINLSRKVTHRNVCRIYDVGTHFDAEQDLSIRYLTMELLEGLTLTRHLRQHGPLSTEEALPIVVQIASGLGAAHAAGVVHRDFKTSNVLLAETSRGMRAVITDFGLSQTLGDDGLTPVDSDKLTGTGQLMGTLAYLAPEQLEGKQASAATDIYALGVMLFQMLTGRLPFDGGSPLMAALKRLHEDPPDPRTVVPDLPETWREVMLCCLQRDQAMRYQNTDELLEALGVEVVPDSSTTIVRPILARATDSGTGPLLAPAPPATTATGTTSTQVPLPKRALPMWMAVVLALGVGLAVLALTQLAPMLASEPSIQVLVAAPVVYGDEAAFVASSFEAAVLRTLASLEGVHTLDSSKIQGVEGPPAELLRTAAADEMVRLEARDVGREWQVQIKRFGRDGEVLGADDFRIPQEDSRLQADAIQVGINRLYPSREATGGTVALEISSEDYQEFLRLRYAVEQGPKDMTWQLLLGRLGDLRRRAPLFVELPIYEARAAAYLYRLSQDESYLEQAFSSLEAARKIAPRDPRPVEHKINLTILVGDLERASAAVDQLSEIAPGEVAVLKAEARLAEAKGEASLAVDRMTKACQIEVSARCRHNLSSYLISNGSHAEARQVLQQVVTTWPSYSYGKTALAELELRYGDIEEARRIYEEVFDRPEFDVNAALNLAVVCLIQNDFDRAAEVYRLVDTKYPNQPTVLIGMADAELLRGDPRAADAIYRRVLNLVPEPEAKAWTAWSLRAQAQAHLGMKADAKRSVERLLELGRDSADAHLLAALVFVVIDEHDLARQEADRAQSFGISGNLVRLPWLREIADG